ncbi:hypothetical protein TNCV_2683571 [Trichonephila clavipes]|nr:hypothetical protein TNCV_2683571 [Trichonephila clavipes]
MLAIADSPNRDTYDGIRSVHRMWHPTVTSDRGKGNISKITWFAQSSDFSDPFSLVNSRSKTAGKNKDHFKLLTHSRQVLERAAMGG